MQHVALGSALAMVGCAPRAEAPAANAAAADLVLRNGAIATMDTAAPRARAIAVRAGRIVALGDDADVRAFIGPHTRVVDLAGRSVVPALTDAHAHLYGLGLALARVDLRGCTSPDACAARARDAADAADEWILGRGWDQNLFEGKAFPVHATLDAVAKERPVWLRRVDGHAGWANAVAMRRAGITRDTPDPSGGRVVRDASGEATGVFVDNAMDLVEHVMPSPSPAARQRAILRGQAHVLARGLTEVHEMGIDDATADAYRELEHAGKLCVRVYAFASGDDAASIERALARAPEPSRPDARFAMRGVKLYADGALGSRGAALLEPYSDDPGNVGLVITPPDLLERTAKRALERGFQIAVHAIGDRANHMVLDAYARAGCASARDHRFRIEHAQIVALTDIARFRELGVIASMQPMHATSDMPWAEARVGRSRLPGAYAWRRFLDAGVTLIGGSDFPVEEVEPLGGNVFAAVTRTDARGEPRGGWLPDQRLSLEEALRAFTVSASFGAFEEAWRGRAAVGQVADLTVLDRDVLGSDFFELRRARVDLTIVGGHVEFERR